MKFSAFKVQATIVENGKKRIEEYVHNPEEPITLEEAKKNIESKYTYSREEKVEMAIHDADINDVKNELNRGSMKKAYEGVSKGVKLGTKVKTNASADEPERIGEVIANFYYKDSTDGTQIMATSKDYVPVQWEDGTKGYRLRTKLDLVNESKQVEDLPTFDKFINK